MSDFERQGDSSPLKPWSPPNLGPAAGPRANSSATQAKLQTAEETAAALRHLADLADAREVARKEGYAEGLAAGQAAADLAASKMLAETRARLDELTRNVGEAVVRSEGAIAEELTQLALKVAQAMTQAALDGRPDIVRSIVQSCIDVIPGVHDVDVHVHPEDLALLRHHDDTPTAHQVSYIPDPRLNRGECHISTPNNAVDGRHRTRWTSLMAALGTTQEWMGDD